MLPELDSAAPSGLHPFQTFAPVEGQLNQISRSPQILTPSLPTHFQAQHFTRFAFNQQLEWPAAYLTIRRKPLCWRACIDHQLKALAAVGALNRFADLHFAVVPRATSSLGGVNSTNFRAPTGKKRPLTDSPPLPHHSIGIATGFASGGPTVLARRARWPAQSLLSNNSDVCFEVCRPIV
jgi:hypothetical protein